MRKRMTTKDVKRRQQEIKQLYEDLILDDMMTIRQEIMESYDKLYSALDSIVKYVEQKDDITQDIYDGYWSLVRTLINETLEENGGAKKIFCRKISKSRSAYMVQEEIDKFIRDMYESGMTERQRFLAFSGLGVTMDNRLNELLHIALDEMSDEICSTINYYESLLYRYEYKVKGDTQQEITEEQQQEFIYKTRKITDRQELLDLAHDNGYGFKRQTGSHMILENDTGEIVVVPIHSCDIGKGLSCKIQKDIYGKNK